MKKTVWLFLVLAVVIGFFIGIYLYNVEENEEELENDIDTIENSIVLNNVNALEIETSVAPEKISVNTQVIEEVYYTECDHLISVTKKDIKSIINMTELQLERKYKDWEIKEFSTEKVVLYREEQNYCGEHFLVKDVDGLVTIYTMNNEEEIKERIEITDIETAYLPQTDQEDLVEGIRVYTQQKLNKLIEDFE